MYPLTGKRANSQPSNRDGLVPTHAPAAVPATYAQAQQGARIRLHAMNPFEDGMIAEYSEESIEYNPQGQLSVVEITTPPGTIDQPETILEMRPQRP